MALDPRDIDRLIRKAAPRIGDSYVAVIMRVNSEVELGPLTDAIEVGDPDAVWAEIDMGSGDFNDFRAAEQGAFRDGGEAAAAGNGWKFDMGAASAVNDQNRRVGRFITETVEETRDMVRNRVLRGVTAGENPRRVALDLVGRRRIGTHRRTGGIIGLTRHQEEWVQGARAELQGDAPLRNYLTRKARDRRFDSTVRRAIRDGRPVPVDIREKMVASYRSRLLRLRGETVGRTEALSAVHAGQHEAIEQAVVDGNIPAEEIERTWYATSDSRVRDAHLAMSGQVRRHGEPFQSPTGARLMYPGDSSLGASPRDIVNCRCTVATRIRRRSAPVPEPSPTPAERFATADQFPATVPEGRSAEEAAWHATSWGNAPANVLSAVGRTRALGRVSTDAPTDQAWMSWTGRLIEMDELNQGTRYGQSVWRHEFGHWMDRKMWDPPSVEGRSALYTSRERAYQSAMTSDLRRLRKDGNVGSSWAASVDKSRNLGQEAANVRRLPMPERRRAVAEMMDEAGLNQAEVEDYLTREGSFGFSGTGQLSLSERDAVLWRFAKAWKDLDGQAIGDVLNVPRGSVAYLGRPDAEFSQLRAWMKENSGSGKMFSDLMDALTRQRVNSGWGHPASYYKRNKDLRGTEVFANVTSVSGESQFGAKLVERFVPKTFKETMDALDKIDQ